MIESVVLTEEQHAHRSDGAGRFDVSTVGVTGASGYVGRALLAELVARGHHVVAIGRRGVASANEFRSADLGSAVPGDLLAGLDVVIHLAANTSGASGASPESEIAFASGLLAQSNAAACRIVFVSSQAADPDAPSVYGRTKASIEAMVLGHGGAVVRPGMVYGDRPDGLYGALVVLVRSMPVLPALVQPRPRVQPIHVSDLACGLARLVDPVDGPQIFRLAGPPLEFSRFLSAITRYHLGRQRVFVPVPVVLLRTLLMLASKLFDARFSPDRLDSLTRLPVMETTSDLNRLELTLRDLRTGLSIRSVRNRALLREAKLLARSTLGVLPTPALARRYARAVTALGAPFALDYPRFVGPRLLAAMDQRSARVAASIGSLPWRIAVLTRLAETEPRLAASFIKPLSEQGRLRALAAIARAGWRELVSRCLSLPAHWLAPRQ